MLVPNWTQGGTEVPQILPWDLSICTISNSSKGQETLALQEQNIFFPRSWQTHYHSAMARTGKCHPQLCLPQLPSWCQRHSTPRRGLKHHSVSPSLPLPNSLPFSHSFSPIFLNQFNITACCFREITTKFPLRRTYMYLPNNVSRIGILTAISTKKLLFFNLSVCQRDSHLLIYL